MNNTLLKYYIFTFFGVRLFTSTLIPFYTEVGHLTHTQIQLLQSIVTLVLFTMEVPTGVTADRFGRKTTLIAGTIFDIVAIIIMAFNHSFAGLVIAQIIFGIGMTLISGADDALIYDTLAAQGKQAEAKNIFGKAHAIHLAGMFVAALLGGYIASKYGLKWPVILSVIPYAIAAAVAWTIKEPRIHIIKHQTKNYTAILKNGVTYLLRHKDLRLMSLDMILVYTAAWFVYWTYPVLLQNFNTPLVYFGVFSAISLAAEIGVASNFVRLERLFGGTSSFLRFSALVTALSFFAVALLPNLFTVFLFVTLAGGFGQARMELIKAYMNRHIDSRERATVLSSISMFRRVGLVIINPLVGFMIDQSLGVALLLLGILPLITLLPQFARQKYDD